MLLPKLFERDLFDDWFDEFGLQKEIDAMNRRLYGKRANREMLTDVKEHDDAYEVDIDLPGFKKDEIEIRLENGYLSISASKGLDKDEKNKKGKVIRQERYSGSMQRSFYVGDNVTQEDVKAKFEDGVLKLTVPKKEAKKLPDSKLISIEG